MGTSAYLLPDDASSLIVSFDQTRSEQHEATAEVTDHPVETGSNIADHVRPQPQTLTLEVFVTNTPINDAGGRGTIATLPLPVPVYVRPPALWQTPIGLLVDAIKSLFQDPVPVNPPPPFTVQALIFPIPFDPVKETHATLLDLWSRGQTMSVVTSTQTYDLMVFTSVSLPRTQPGGAAFSLAMKQIRTVSSQSVTAPKPSVKRGTPNAAKGSQATTNPNGSDASKVSALKQGFNSLIGALGGGS